MSAIAVFAIVVTGLIVAVLAIFLIRVALILRHVNGTLGLVTFGVRAIAFRVEPINPVVSDINVNLSAVAGALDATLAKASRAH